MKITGATKLAQQLRDIPESARFHIAKTIKRNTERGAALARTLVPVDSGELKGWIYTKYSTDGMFGSIEAAPPRKEPQKKAFAVEFGRTNGDKGTTNPAPYMRIMQKHLSKIFNASIRSAIRKAVKEATSG